MEVRKWKYKKLFCLTKDENGEMILVSEHYGFNLYQAIAALRIYLRSLDMLDRDYLIKYENANMILHLKSGKKYTVFPHYSKNYFTPHDLMINEGYEYIGKYVFISRIGETHTVRRIYKRGNYYYNQLKAFSRERIVNDVPVKTYYKLQIIETELPDAIYKVSESAGETYSVTMSAVEKKRMAKMKKKMKLEVIKNKHLALEQYNLSREKIILDRLKKHLETSAIFGDVRAF